MDGYKCGGHTKYSLKIHLIFVTKYRRKIFIGCVDDDVKQFMYEAAIRLGCSIIEMETDKDHIHLLLEYRPNITVSDVAGRLKQYTTHRMWRYHGCYLSRFYWKKHILWSDGYFACSIGQASQETIEHYIRNQG
jgi:putative transposase